MSRNNHRSSSLRQVENVPVDDLSMREVDSGGSPRSGGSFRLSAALAAERDETRRRLSRELDEDNNRIKDDKDSNESPHGNEDEDEDEDEDKGIPGLGPPSGQPMQMSLMDLLDGYNLDDEEEEEEEDADDEVGGDDRKEEFSCCVCMVKHKGGGLIPCGHTYCMLCSKELCVQKGNCALCNNFILEILDIF